MDGSHSRKSDFDATATRKRRSSILKSQRCVRAPLSELEFTVATPDQAKSRRVSFSRCTGVAEFEINQATTAWKNVYEEHNKSLESSANESGLKAAPRRVGHLGTRASHFQDDQDDGVQDPVTAQLDELATNANTTQIFHLELNPSYRELTDAMVPLTDDLDLLRQDLEREPKHANISASSIDVDFNATHFSLRTDDDDDMSITDTIRSPAVAATKKQVDDWTVDKENIVVNPYVAPPPAEFTCEDDILVFDGKKCKFQSKLDLTDAPLESVGTENIPPKTVFLDDMTETQAIPVQIFETEDIKHKSVLNTEPRTVVFEDGDISVTQAVANNIIAPKAVQEDKENQKTMYFNDLADMSVTQALPADIIQYEPQRKTVLYEDDAHISMTEAVPARVLAGPENLALEANLEIKRSIVYENADVSMTDVVSGNIHEIKGNEDRRKTIVYGNDDGNVSITGVLPTNIIDKVKIQPNMDQRKTIVFDDKDGHVSMTVVLPANIIDETKLVPPPNTDRRKTIVYGNDNGNVSVTGVLPTNIIDEAKLTQLNTHCRTTVVLGNDDGNLSGVAPVNTLHGAKVTQEPNTSRRKTIVYNNDDGNVSMTGVLPANIIDEAKVQQSNLSMTGVLPSNIIDEAKVQYPNLSMTGVLPSNIIDEAKVQHPNLSMTGVLPANIINEAKVQQPNLSMTGVLPANIIDEAKVSQSMDRRKTVVFGNDDGNLSITGVAPVNILDGAKYPNADRRKTIVYENDGGNISMTGVVPVNILDGAKDPNADRRNTIVYRNDGGNISMTGVVPVNILDGAKDPNADRRKTIVYENDGGNISMTGIVPVNILDGAKDPNADRRNTIVYRNDGGNISMTGVVPVNILDGAKDPNADRRKTIVYENDGGNISMTGVVPVNILDGAKDPNADRRKTIVYRNDAGSISMTGVVPVNILDGAKETQDPYADHRKTIVYGNDEGNISVTGVVPVNILDEAKHLPTDRRKTVGYDKDDGNVSKTGFLPPNILDDGGEMQPLIAECRKTVVYDEDNGNLSMTGVAPINILDGANEQNTEHKTVEYATDGGKLSLTAAASELFEDANEQVNEPNTECRKTVVFDVSMTDTIPANIVPEDTNFVITTFNKSTANQDTTSLNKSLGGQIISAIDNILADQTFDKSLADQRSATFNKSLDGQISTALEKSFPNQEQTFNKSLAGQVISTTFYKSSADVTTTFAQNSQADSHSATFNKSLADQDVTNKSSASQEYPATLNKSLAGQECATINKSLTAHSMSMNKTLTSNVLVYGATTEREAKDNSYIVDGFNLEENQSQESPNASLALSKSSTEQLARSRAEAAAMTPPKESVLDVLLDMSQASREDICKPESNTVTEPVSNVTVTVTDSVPTSESYILVKDDEPDVTEPLAIEYKKHGIVSKLQRKLYELKDTLLVKQKSPKKDKNKNENQDLTQNTSNLDTPKTTDSFEKSKLPKPSLKSISSTNKDAQEKNKSVRIDLTSKMSMDDEEEALVENQIQVDLTSIEDKEQANTTKCQANDTKAILDALSDFTDTRHSGDCEPAQNPDKTKRSSAPDRKSMVLSREDLLREISMAQALMKTEMAQTDMELDVTEGSSDEEHSPPRLSGDVVKTLRFEDDDSILESKILQKPLSPDSPPFRTSSVIPTYEISDPVKELMKDLIKPLADVEQPSLSEPCQSTQAEHLDSSQIDLIPSKPVLVSPRSCLRKNEQEVAHSEMHVDSPRKEPEPVIVFDHLNPLNNIVIPPLDRAVVHKYNPVESCHSLESQCCQTDAPEPRNVEVGMVLMKPMVDRGVASSLKLGILSVDRAVATNSTVKDCEVNTSIVMKGNRELLADSSSLTLVDDVLPRSPVRVIFKLDEPNSSVMLDSDLSSVHDLSDNGRKRGHVASKGPEVTPKPAIKVQKVSNNTKVSRRPQNQSPERKEIKESSPSTRDSSVTVAQLYACARGVTSASATDSRCSRVSDWCPELLHEASSKNLVAEQESGVNVVAKIDILPFMGSSECEWESRAADTWTFRLLRARLRLLVRLEHRATNTTRVLVRADTPVKLVTVQHAIVDQERTEPVAALCLCLAAEALQRICCRGVARAGAVPALLRRCAAVARVALHWGRCMRQASAALAFSLAEDGCLSLKVANIPLRSVWEVTLRVELCDDGRGTPHPRAVDVAVTRVVAAWAPPTHELRAVLAAVPQDWGHVPRTIWRIFKYLKNKKPEDDLLIV